ncbi:MAG: IS1182 family transposase [Hormoscilla sp. GUM202]|nr:IS1182 family transposase [Hormoscilla sp. GUM202]
MSLFIPELDNQPCQSAKLALVTVMQFAEGLTDRQAADAVRSRIDWKYALGLELTDSGFDHTILKEFRERLIAKEKENLLLEKMLLILSSQKLVKARGQARTDSTHVLAAIRHLNRLELVVQTLRQALNELATQAPTWLLTQIGTDWFDRYGSRLDQYRLPKDKTERSQLALTIGTDGHHILQAVDEATKFPQLRELKTVKILRSVWVQQYVFVKGKLLWRDPKTTGMAPNKKLIESPYDPEARNATKRDSNWTGYKVHLTETCDEDGPHIITNVETTPATTVDGDMRKVIHEHLDAKQLLPQEHLLDSAYVDAEHLVTSRADYQVELVGKVLPDTSWQARNQTGFDISCFAIDWERHQVTCPQGNVNRTWRNRTDCYQNRVIEVHFSRADCVDCPARELCTHSLKSPRLLKLRPPEQHQALQAARQRQTTDEFKLNYAKRAGCEATISQGIRAFDLRRSRYKGLAKTNLQHIAVAIAINLSRLRDWWARRPVVSRRLSPFTALLHAAKT